MVDITDASGFYNSLMNVPGPNTGSYTLVNNIDMSGSIFPPKTIINFQGTLDGSGNTLTINISDISGVYSGLFRDISGGTVRNLIVRYIGGPSTYNISVPFAPLLFGFLTANCTNSSILENNTVIYDASCNQIIIRNTSTGQQPSSNYTYLGGLVGFNQFSSQIRNCNLQLNKDITFDISSNLITMYGGLVGVNNNGADISGCSGSFRNINVIVASNAISSSALINNGLIVGLNSISGSTITNTSIDVSGSILMRNTIVNVAPSNIGCLFGNNNNGASIINCSGNIRGTSQLIGITSGGTNNIGGVIGQNNINNALIQQCNITYNDQLDISGNSTTGVINVGGIVGSNVATADISGCSGSFRNFTLNLADISGTIISGGLAGVNAALGSTITNTSVDISGNFISKNTTTNIIAENYLGGLVGRNLNGAIISDCSGNIRGTTQLIGTTITASNYIGGLIGLNDISGALVQRSNITYNNQLDISGTSTSGPLRIGGLAGLNTNTADISGCSGSFRNTTILLKNISGNINSGGLIGRNEVTGTTLTNTFVDYSGSLLILGDNSGNGVVYIGGLYGQNTNGAIISDCSGNIRGITQLIGNTISGNNRIGGLIGQNDTSGALLQLSNITYNDQLDISGTSTSGAIMTGGLAGLNGFTADISGCSGSFNTVNAIINGNNIVYIGGLIGYNDISGFIFNNIATIGSDSHIESIGASNNVSMGGLIGYINGGDISGNSIIYGDKLTLRANNTAAPTVYLNSDYGDISGGTQTNNTVTFVTYPLEFQSIGTDASGITFESNNYYPDVTVYGPGFNIDVSDLTLYIYLYNAPEPSIVFVSEIPPCCIANTLNPNPQVTDYDSSIREGNTNNSTLVKSVDQYYLAVASGVRTAHSQPMFSSYQAYVQYLQGKNKR